MRQPHRLHKHVSLGMSIDPVSMRNVKLATTSVCMKVFAVMTVKVLVTVVLWIQMSCLSVACEIAIAIVCLCVPFHYI